MVLRTAMTLNSRYETTLNMQREAHPCITDGDANHRSDCGALAYAREEQPLGEQFDFPTCCALTQAHVPRQTYIAKLTFFSGLLAFTRTQVGTSGYKGFNNFSKIVSTETTSHEGG